MWESNVAGVMRVTKALLPALRRGRDPQIVDRSARSRGSRSTRAAAATPRPSTPSTRSPRPCGWSCSPTAIRVTEVAPGMVETEFSLVRFDGDAERAAEVYEGLEPLTGDDVAEAIAFCVTRPAHVDIDYLGDQADRPGDREDRPPPAISPPETPPYHHPADANRRAARPTDARCSRSSSSRRRPSRGCEQLFETVEALKPLEPDYVSVTYGAGGATRDGTVEIAERIKHEHGIEVMAHLSCVGETRDGLAAILDRFAAIGIENVLALRGDPPRGEAEFDAARGRARRAPPS